MPSNPSRPLLRRPSRARVLALGGWILLAAGLAILIHHFDAGSVPRGRLFHTEAIYPAALYLDLESWATWNTPFAPYFFPDIPLFFLCLWVTGDPVPAVYAFGASQYLLLILGFHWLFGAVLAREGPMLRIVRRSTVLMGALLVLAFSFGFHGGGVFLQLFTAAFHTGSFVLTVYGLAALIALLNQEQETGSRARREGGLLLLLFCLSFSGVLSDRLLLALFVAPAIAALAFATRPKAARLRAAFALSAGGILGHLAIPWINSMGKIRIATYAPIDTAGVIEMLRSLPDREPDLFAFVRDRYFESLGTTFRTYWSLWALLTLLLIFASRRWLIDRKGFRHLDRLTARSRSNLSFFALFMILSFGATSLATCYATVGHYGLVVGNHGILFVTRYLIALYTIPLVAAALYLPVLLGARKTSRLELPLLAVLAILCVVQGSRVDLESPFPRYRPQDVACLDERAAELGLRHGLAFFSDARRVNVFSRRGLYVDQVTWNLEPITWIASRRRPGEEAGYDFVITNSLRNLENLVARQGEPTRELDCPDLHLFVYSPPASVAPTPRAIRNTASHSSSPPTGTSNTPRPGSPP